MMVPSFPKLSETFIVNKFIGLLDLGIDVHIFCGTSYKSEWAHFPSLLKKPGVRKRVHVCWPIKPLPVSVLLFLPALISSLIRKPIQTLQYFSKGIKASGFKVVKEFYLDREILLVQPDILHYEFGALAVKKEYLAARIDTKLVVSFRGHDIEFTGIDIPDYFTDLWSNISGVHFLGNALKRKAIERGFSESIPHVLIPPSIDIEKYSNSEVRPIDDRSQPIRILSVGRLHWVKGYEFALEALSLLSKKGYSFEYHMVGEGDELPSLAFCCHQLGIDDHVTFLGSLSPDLVIKEMKWADIFLHPAVEEGFGNAVIEAQAMQIPVVCSDAVGLPENVENGITGFVVPRRNPQAIADALTRLVCSKDLRIRMGKASRERVMDKYQLKEQLSSFILFYSEIVQRNSRS